MIDSMYNAYQPLMGQLMQKFNSQLYIFNILLQPFFKNHFIWL